jgi:hypothetical protein
LGKQGCGLAEAAPIAEFLAAESARQCGPCRFGLRASAEALTSIVDLRARLICIFRGRDTGICMLIALGGPQTPAAALRAR